MRLEDKCWGYIIPSDRNEKRLPGFRTSNALADLHWPVENMIVKAFYHSLFVWHEIVPGDLPGAIGGQVDADWCVIGDAMK